MLTPLLFIADNIEARKMICVSWKFARRESCDYIVVIAADFSCIQSPTLLLESRKDSPRIVNQD